MSTKINLTYFGMDGQGATVKEAKQDAGRKIEAALSGYHFPNLYTKTVGSVTYTVFIFRVLDKWGYAYVKHGAEKEGRQFASANDNSEEAAFIHAWRHIAGNEFTFTDDGRAWLEPKDSDGLRELVYMAKWQHLMKAWQSLGKTSEEARSLTTWPYAWPEGYAPTYTP